MGALRTFAVVLAAAAALVAVPAHAAGLTISVDSAWGGLAPAQGFCPFVITVSNSTGTDFQGSVELRPNPPSGMPSSFYLGAAYQAPVTVPQGQTRKVTIYAGPSMSGQYLARLLDPGGLEIATATASPGTGTVVGVLSDSPALVSIEANALGGTATGAAGAVHRYTVADLPPTAAYLGGLAEVVVADFDSASLSQAQVGALQDYAAFGGTLVLVGGGQWRRTFAAFAADLPPLRPDRTETDSVAAIGQLVGVQAAGTADLAAGQLAPGARVVVATAAARPLMVVRGYGSGRIVELTFDPSADSVGQGAGVLATSMAVSASAAPAAQGYLVPGKGYVISNAAFAPGSASAAGGPAMPVPTLNGQGDQMIQGILLDAPQAALPSLLLLAGLLLLYVLLAGPVNYLVLRAWRRRELMWVTVPVAAILFTGSAYAGSNLSRGSAAVDNQVLVLQLGLGGRAEATAFHGLFAPHRGDFELTLAPDSLTGTLNNQNYGSGSGDPSGGDIYSSGRTASVKLRNVALWGERSIKQVTDVGAGVAVETHIVYAGGRLQGTIRNTGTRTVTGLELVAPSGDYVEVNGALAPGQSVSLDAKPVQTQSSQGPVPQGALSGYGWASQAALGQAPPYFGYGSSAHLSDDDKRFIAGGVAAAPVLARGQIAVVGVVDASVQARLDGVAVSGSRLAAFAQPIALEAADRLPTQWAPAALLLSASPAGTPIAVYDIVLPAHFTGTPLVQALGTGAGGPGPTPGPAPGPTTSGSGSAEIYDWVAGAWIPAGTGLFQATPSELSGGALRIRQTGSGLTPPVVQTP